MQDESSSNSVNLEQDGETVYKCPHCLKVFESARARGGHQNAHREKPALRTYKGKKLSELHPVLTAALRHHVSAGRDGLVTSNSNMPEISTRVDGSSTDQQENKVVQSKSNANNEASSSQYHPHKKPKKELRTIDYLTVRGSTMNVDDRVLSSSSTGTRSNKSKMGLVDLELKLGL